MHKRILLFAAAIVLTLSANLYAKQPKEHIETPASDSRIEYTGRTYVNGPEVSYDWSGVYFRVKFNGTYLAMRCSDTKSNWFNMWVDKEISPVAYSRAKAVSGKQAAGIYTAQNGQCLTLPDTIY